MAMSTWTPPSPLRRSTHSPSTGICPASDMPRVVKKATIAAGEPRRSASRLTLAMQPGRVQHEMRLGRPRSGEAPELRLHVGGGRAVREHVEHESSAAGQGEAADAVGAAGLHDQAHLRIGPEDVAEPDVPPR